MILGSNCVTFYSTNPATTAQIRNELAAFAPTLPQGADITLLP